MISVVATVWGVVETSTMAEQQSELQLLKEQKTTLVAGLVKLEQ